MAGWATDCLAIGEPASGRKSALYEFDGSNPSPPTIFMNPLAEQLPNLPETPGVYVLLGKNGMHYTGAARNLRERLRDHQAGRGKRTKNQRPLYLVYHESISNYSAALERETFLKSGKGREWLAGQQTVSP